MACTHPDTPAAGDTEVAVEVDVRVGVVRAPATRRDSGSEARGAHDHASRGMTATGQSA